MADDLRHLPPDAALLALADPAAGPDEPPAALALTIPAGPGTVELRRYLVHDAEPGRAVGARLLASVADWWRAAGCRRMVATTPAGDPERTAQFLAAGFRPSTDPAWHELLL